MNKYEAMVIVKPGLSEEEKTNLFRQINEAVTKFEGKVVNGAVWSEKRRLCFPIKKQQEGIYYLLNFQLPPLSLKDLRHIYSLNENILRTLFTVLD